MMGKPFDLSCFSSNKGLGLCDFQDTSYRQSGQWRDQIGIWDYLLQKQDLRYIYTHTYIKIYANMYL